LTSGETARVTGVDRDLSNISVRAYTTVEDGPIAERKASREFWAELECSIDNGGYSFVDEVSSGLNVPDNLVEKLSGPRFTNALGVDDLVVAFQLFLATPVGQWAVDKVCDGIYDGMLLPALRKLFGKRKDAGFATTAFTFVSGVWYDTTGVYIGAAAEVSGLDEERLGELLKKAQRQGLDWLSDHGIAKPVLLYEIREGELSIEPRLLDSVPIRP
jgi:hypothetical protein